MDGQNPNITPVAPNVAPPTFTQPPAAPPALPEDSGSSWLERLRSILSTVLLLLAAPLLALFLTAFVFQSYQVEGPSMEQTLHNNDRLIVLKMPRSWARITHHTYFPNRGDIIIFTKHGDFEDAQLADKQLIKRVIGLPGDRVVVKDGVVTVYNDKFPAGFQPDKTGNYASNINYTSGELDLTIGDNQVFVLGDNRGNSLDSRAFGPVPATDIVGKLVLRLYPFDQVERF